MNHVTRSLARIASIALVPALLGSIVTGCGEVAAPVASTTATETYVIGVEGMHCDGCANAIRTKVGRVDGVASCDVSFEEARAVIVAEASARDEAITAIETLGYTITPETSETP